VLLLLANKAAGIPQSKCGAETVSLTPVVIII